MPATPARTTRRLRRRLAALAPQVATRAWHVTSLLWQVFCAALFPIDLRTIPAALDRFLAHLTRGNERARTRRLDLFHRSIREKPA